jgi:tetratricopeptide (TPR) repeat protein
MAQTAKARFILFASLLLLILYLSSCTPRAYVNRAQSWAKRKTKLDTALKLVNRAQQLEETKNWPRTYFVKGYIYQKMYETAKEGRGNHAENPLFKACEYYNKAYEMGYKGSLKETLAQMHQYFMDDGLDFYRNHQYARALPNLAHTIKISEMPLFPEHVDTSIIYKAGFAAQKTGNWEQAERYYKKAIHYAYMGAEPYQQISTVLLEQGKEKEAVKRLKEGLKKFPSSEDILASLINYYLKRGNEPKKALQYLNMAIKEHPNQTSYLSRKGVVHEQLGQTEKAKKAYIRAIEADPRHFLAHYNLGIIFFNQAVKMESKAYRSGSGDQHAQAWENYEKALQCMKKARELKPGDLAVISTIKLLYYILGADQPEYKEDYRQISREMESLEERLHSDDIAPLKGQKHFVTSQGIKAFENNNYRTAFLYFRYALKLNEMPVLQSHKDTTLIFNTGLAAYKLNQWDAAARYFEQATKLNRNGGRTYLLLSKAYKKAGNDKKALETLKKGLVKHPSNASIVGRLVNHYLFDSRHPEECLKYLKMAIEADPGNAQNYAARGQIYEMVNKPRKAKTSYLKALELEPDLFAAHYNLGHSIYYNEGVKLLSKANNVRDQELHRNHTQKATRKFEKAARHLERAHEIKPRNTSVLSSLKSLYYRLRDKNERYRQRYREILSMLKNYQ